jgi:tetratricopeptide (TPR) repeat protein
MSISVRLIPEWSREEIYYIAERGYRLYSQGRLREAAILFEGLIVIDPENAYCRKALAAIGIGLGQHWLAVRQLSTIIARDRFDIDALAGRCEALMATGDFAGARRDLESVAALPAGVENARRLRLQFLQQSEFAPNPPKPSQLLPGPSR